VYKELGQLEKGDIITYNAAIWIVGAKKTDGSSVTLTLRNLGGSDILTDSAMIPIASLGMTYLGNDCGAVLNEELFNLCEQIQFVVVEEQAEEVQTPGIREQAEQPEEQERETTKTTPA